MPPSTGSGPATSESSILTSYLLQPAPLTAIVTLDQFRALFPASAPPDSVRTLFRDLQAQRAGIAQDVAKAIAAEAARGAAMRREVVIAARKDRESGEVDGEVEMERALFAEKSAAKSAKHTINSIVPELEGAAGALEVEIAKLEEEEATLTDSIRRTVGGLSDLRYGKFANAQLRDEIVDGLASLQQACEEKSSG